LPEDDGPEADLGKMEQDMGANSLTYLYGFGDGWEHTIKIE
jgi:hypothetical protein